MPVEVKLCKFANQVTEDERVHQSGRCFMRHGKNWIMLDIFTEDEMQNLLYINQMDGFKDTESDDGDALFATYTQYARHRIDQQYLIFSIVFENYVLTDDLCLHVRCQPDKQHQVIKSQVTNKFFDALLLAHQQQNRQAEDRNVSVLCLPECFLPTLCRYQERTVNWLLQREQQPKQLSPYFMRLQAKDGITCLYKNLLDSEFYASPPPNIQLPPGGILADEMGLGKTVMLLALILLNKRPTVQCMMPKVIEVADENEDTTSPAKKPRKDINLHCFCGVDKIDTKKDKLINCKKCNLWQHVRCSGKHDAAHSDDINEPYLCPGCWKDYSEAQLIPSRATLIVTPSTIRSQWLNEIKRHIDATANLRVFNYEGAISKDWISPRQLADYDVVLTDYNVLQKEVFYTSAQETGRVLRKRTKCLRKYTPLLMIEWWRCCLDEAQMTESFVSKMAALVRSIPALNRWAVSGTPIQRSIEDLYPLLRFCGLEDFINSSAWTTLIRDFMQNCDNNEKDLSSLHLIKILRNFMWRTGKAQVKDELPIPSQTEIVHKILLSDLERLYYNEQHKKCKENFEETLGKYFESSQSVLSTSHYLMGIIMKPLLRIRMCCTIPTVIAPRNQQALTGVTQKQFLQPKELHAHLLVRNEMDCKGHLRSIASAFNGLAAIHFIQGKHTEAVENYEEVLKLANEYAAQKSLGVDTLLQIHALYNILQARNFSPALEAKRSKEIFERYELQLNTLEWKYLETYASQLLRINQSFSRTKNTLQMKTQSLEEDLLSFVSNLLQLDDVNLQTQLLAKILEECIRKFGSMRLEAASSLRGVLYIIKTWFDKLQKVQSKIIGAFEELKFFTDNIKPRSEVTVETWRKVSQFITSVCDCHIIELRELESERENDADATQHDINRSQRRGKNACKLCKLIEQINSYECLLFKKSIDLLTNAVEGDENPQLEFEIIRIIFSFLRPKLPAMAADIENHFAVLQSMQQFCKIAIKFWIEIEFTVKAYDELDMCKMRMTLTDDPAERNNYKIMRHELDLNFARQQQNLKYAQHCFDLKYARLKYIKHLETNTEVGACPICQSDDEKRHAFLICGHQVCWACYKFLTHISHGTRITCSLCRNEQPTESVYFMTSSNKIGLPTDGEIIKGDYSAKLTYIIQLLKKLIREHKASTRTVNDNDGDTLDNISNANDDFPLKVLIFSQWAFVLKSLADALAENGISYSHSTNVRSIEKFRKPDSGITCLLMPLSKGCKGLNLIEATHVFLIEPVLNPSEELQAIGRIHRFGQTRPTTVHRFIVEETVEENIYELVSAGKSSSQGWQFEFITLENLRELFTQVRY